MMNIDWTTVIGQLLNFILFSGLLWALKKLVEKVENLGNRITILETEHGMYKQLGGCPIMKGINNDSGSSSDPRWDGSAADLRTAEDKASE